MQKDRPYVVSIAGFDPSGGAGVLADCKTFEQLKVYGFGICSALTIQNDSEFLKVHWVSEEQIIEQLQPLTKKFTIAAAKIGLIQSPEVAATVIRFLKEYNPSVRIVWDPVLRASAGYDFHSANAFHSLEAILSAIDLITPNYDELERLNAFTNQLLVKGDDAVFTNVLLKGGHRPDAPGTDTLYEAGKHTIIAAGVEKVYAKHGSGCVLSASITARLALGDVLIDACRFAKQYVESFLNSHPSLLGYHTIC